VAGTGAAADPPRETAWLPEGDSTAQQGRAGRIAEQMRREVHQAALGALASALPEDPLV
jgi:hypothetical protein